MPIYEYRCRACGHEFEELVRNRAEAEAVTCPACARAVERLLSRPAAVAGGAPARRAPGCGPVG